MKPLVESLTERGVVSDPRVAEVLNSVDRAEFCLPAERNPYEDHPHSIGHSATISAPHMHAFALTHSLPTIDSLRNSPALSAGGMEAAQQRPVKILDVGSGSGYLTVALAELAGPSGKVVGIEHVPELTATAQRNAEKSHADLLREGRIKFVTGDGREGYPAEAPYDIIHVGAAAPQVPQKLIDQLAPGGRMIIPVGSSEQFVEIIEKDMNGNVSRSKSLAVRYVPLTDPPKQ